MRLILDTNAYTAFCLGEDQVLQLMENADELQLLRRSVQMPPFSPATAISTRFSAY